MPIFPQPDASGPASLKDDVFELGNSDDACKPYDDDFDSLENLERRMMEIERMVETESKDDEVDKLKAEVERLKQHNRSLRLANDELYQAMLEKMKLT
ncbi:hypothetical protein HDU67_009444 [Dinochytrium kinnereticum]|nr:hypothetical protein HDU67_009444 [Dinochytrium kinnereticum]